MELSELFAKRRSIRFYRQSAVKPEDLRALVAAARHAPSAANNQVLRYTLVHSAGLVEKLFSHTAWGGRVKPHRNPEWGKTAPTAFIAVSTTSADAKVIHADAGAAIMLMELRAVELGLGTCWIGAFHASEVTVLLELPPGETLLYLLAVGHPAETPVEESIEAGEAPGYYLDGANTIHVPKFSVNALSREK